ADHTRARDSRSGSHERVPSVTAHRTARPPRDNLQVADLCLAEGRAKRSGERHRAPGEVTGPAVAVHVMQNVIARPVRSPGLQSRCTLRGTAGRVPSRGVRTPSANGMANLCFRERHRAPGEVTGPTVAVHVMQNV